MCKKYVIFTDLTCDLSEQERIKYGIWPEVFTQHMDCDCVPVPHTDPDAFYVHLDNGDYPPGSLKTASAGVEEAFRVLDDIIAKTDPETTIVYAGVSPQMSPGTIATMRLAINDYAEKYPDRKFILIDSMCISNGLATFLEYLAKYDGDDIEGYAEQLGKHIVHLFTERDFTYSLKSGRYNLVERIVMLTMSKMHISPWMYFPSTDKLSMSGRLHKGDKLLHAWVDYYNNHVAPDNEFVRIGYGGAAELPRAQKLVRLLKERAGLTDEQIQLTHVSPIVGAHTGSTVLSFFFKQTDER